MKRGLLVVIFGSVVAVAAGQARTATKYTGTLTGGTVEECCCIQKGGKLYCTLANRMVDPGCCKPAEK